MADPPGRPECDRRPHGVARGRGARRHVAGPPVDGPLPQHQPAGGDDRHDLHRRQRPGRREDRHLPHREGGQRGARGAPRRVAQPARDLGRPGVVQLRRRPGRRAERDHPAHPADQQHSARRHQAAVHREVRPLEHPGVPAHGVGRRPRREAALRRRLQHHRAPDRAHQRGRLRQRRRRQDPADRRQPGPGPPVREGDLRPGRRAVRQRLQLSHAVGRHQDRHRRLQPAHQQPVPAREADGGHRRPEGRRRPRPRPRSSATCPTRTRRNRASSGSTASGPSTCG